MNLYLISAECHHLLSSDFGVRYLVDIRSRVTKIVVKIALEYPKSDLFKNSMLFCAYLSYFYAIFIDLKKNKNVKKLSTVSFDVKKARLKMVVIMVLC